jgi:DNA repair protein RadC
MVTYGGTNAEALAFQGPEEKPEQEAREKSEKAVQDVSDVPHYHGHRQRLKARFLQEPIALPDYELLELVLYLVYPRRDVKPLAKAMLAQYGSLQAVFKQVTESGSGAFYARARLFLETSRRMTLHELRQQTLLNTTHRVLEYCHITLSHSPVERFHLFFLDKKYHLLRDEAHQGGTLDQVPLYPREVLRRALELNAANIIMVHNHPSGDPRPSHGDIEVTKHLRHSLMPFAVHIVDHFIIGKHGYFSFRENGLMG